MDEKALNEPSDKWVSRSGATSSGKLAGYDMIPEIFLTRVAQRFSLGEKKHGKFNYRKGLRDKEYILERLNHALLHLKLATDQIQQGVMYDDDDLGAVGCNIAMAMEYQAINDLMEPSQLVFRTKDQWIRTLNSNQNEAEAPSVAGPANEAIMRELAMKDILRLAGELHDVDIRQLLDYLRRVLSDRQHAQSPR